MNTEGFTCADGSVVGMTVWDASEPRAVTIIVHGMAEHIGRYARFAAGLAAAGSTVVGIDLRGHGKTYAASLGTCAGDPFEDTVGDVIALYEKARDEYGLPVTLFGHGYGACVVRRMLQLGVRPAAVVLSGCGAVKRSTLKKYLRIATRGARKNGDAPAADIALRTLNRYDNHFGDGIGGRLYGSVVAAGEYNADPLCGFVCSYRFYESLLGGIERIIADENPRVDGMRILLVAGGDDVMVKDGALVEKLGEEYRAAGADVTVRLYAGARHAVWDDDASFESVIADIIAFILPEA